MLFNKIETKRNKEVLLKAFYKGDKAINGLIEKNGAVTEFLDKNEAYIYLCERDKVTFDSVYNTFKSLAENQGRSYQVDLASFKGEKVCEAGVTKALVRAVYFVKGDIYSAKTNKKDCDLELSPYLDLAKIGSKEIPDWINERFNKEIIYAEATNWARNLQMTPPNVCNSEYMAEQVAKDFKEYKNLKVKVLNKKEIEAKKMGLLLSVNRGSVYEPRVVVIEYNGDKSSKEKTALVGKGITFDSGGYSLKPSRGMLGMKFDMSGAAIVAATMKAIAQTKPEVNFSAVLCITDNRVNGDASLPDSVWTSMNGKSVEINNTDAEGRLVMADGLTYAVRELKATRLIDVATLTGAMVVALGTTYTGVWSTTDEAWAEIQDAAEHAKEKVWRMPFDEAFAKNIRSSKVADLKNTDLSGNAGSCSAAMFLKEFTEDVEYIHCDVAGTAEISEMAQGAMVKTLAELALKK